MDKQPRIVHFSYCLFGHPADFGSSRIRGILSWRDQATMLLKRSKPHVNRECEPTYGEMTGHTSRAAPVRFSSLARISRSDANVFAC